MKSVVNAIFYIVIVIVIHFSPLQVVPMHEILFCYFHGIQQLWGNIKEFGKKCSTQNK